jgi:Zn-dependent peptidase ImmA (M78 family)/DNA-binding XRE family transcriptional regulator
VQSSFVPRRVTLARELKGWSQAELSRRLEVTPAALSQFESGSARPGPETRNRLAAILEVPDGFFDLPTGEPPEGFFRSLRRTSISDRRRAAAIGCVAHDIAASPGLTKQLPAPTIPHLRTESLDDEQEVERIASQVRSDWQLKSGPVPDLVAMLERHGAIVIRLPLDSPDVDAFSLPFADHPVIVLGSDKNDKARSRFDAAHELGHLVVHGDEMWGTKEIETQAHRFAAAFLMPRQEIFHELPTRPDWAILFGLKRKWQVSLAALLMRARTLGRMSEAAYLSAVKDASARGWRRREPIPLGRPEQPQALARLLSLPEANGARSTLPTSVVEALAAAVAL